MPGPDPMAVWIETEENGGFSVYAERPLWGGQNHSRIARVRAICRKLAWDGWTCQGCGEPIPHFRRADAVYCREACRKAVQRQRRKWAR